MKNFVKLFCIISIFTVLKANGQNYSIAFAGSGATTTLSTVKVENLTKGTSLTLSGSDILHLTGTTGVNSIKNKQSPELKIYPNPTTDNSILQIYPPDPGDAIISVLDINGKPVAQIQSYLENYLQEFRLSGINTGFYLVSVKGTTYQYSGKLLANGKVPGTIKIEKISNNQVTEEKISQTNNKGVQATVDMAFTTGDRLKFTSISGNYSTVITDIPTQDKTITFNLIPCSDGDNVNYPVVRIGTQTWMAENLKTTNYNDGTAIPLVTDPTAWSNLTSPGYCWNSNNGPAYKITYGALYNWYAVNTGKLCPTGWHIPTDEEWTVLANLLGGETFGGGKLKETGTGHWESPNTEATNESGFTALPGGHHYSYGSFLIVGTSGFWWSSSNISTTIAWSRRMNCYSGGVWRLNDRDKKFGFSVRCLKDN